MVSEEFPFLLTTGRSLYQFNAGSLTMRTANSVLRPADFLHISPDDARRLHFENGDTALVHSHYGEASLPIQIDPAIKPGDLFATFHTAETFLNYLTGPHLDAHTSTPEYKVTAVRIEKM